MEQVRVHAKDIELLKLLFSVLVTSYEDGANFNIVDLTTVNFIARHKYEELQSKVGDLLAPNGPAEKIINAKDILKFHFDQDIYDRVRMFTIGGPIWADDDSDVVGAWVLVVPRLHKIIRSFDYFAPIMAGLFPEGGMLYTTDKNKLVKRQGSAKFDVPQIAVGSDNWEASVEALSSGKEVIREIPESKLGVPAQVSCTPLYDEETSEIVGTFGLILPRQLATHLKDMAKNLQASLTEVSAAMQQIAISSSEISKNQVNLHNEIKSVEELAITIDNITGLIKVIADQTKMLGLNAAIEAARAGDLGRGFGVVAEEIRKLSDESKQTADKIRALTSRIHESIGTTTQTSGLVLETLQESVAATQEINASLEEITAFADQLDKLAADL